MRSREKILKHRAQPIFVSTHQRLFEHRTASHEECLPQLARLLQSLGTKWPNIESLHAQCLRRVLNCLASLWSNGRQAIIFEITNGQLLDVVETWRTQRDRWTYRIDRVLSRQRAKQERDIVDGPRHWADRAEE